MRQKTKERRGHGLREAFQELVTLNGTKPVIVEDILVKYGVINAVKVATAIRQNYLIATKKKFYGWNPEKNPPKNVEKFAVMAIEKYQKPASTKTVITETVIKPKAETKHIPAEIPPQTEDKVKRVRTETLNQPEAEKVLREILLKLKKTTKFQNVRLETTLRTSKIPYYALMGPVIKKDFLEKGPKPGYYRWKDKNVEVPDTTKYYQRIKEYAASLPSNSKQRKNTVSVPDDANNASKPAPAIKEAVNVVKTVTQTDPRPAVPFHDRHAAFVKDNMLNDFNNAVAELKAQAIAQAQAYGVFMTNEDFMC